VPAHTSRATASDRVAVEGSERRACERKEPAGHFNVHGDDATTFLELTADASSACETKSETKSYASTEENSAV